MLVLSRKIGEEIVIDGSIRVTIVAVQSGRVRVGITAPPDMHIVRSELDPLPAWAGKPGRERELCMT